jgi:hypothetical protein
MKKNIVFTFFLLSIAISPGITYSAEESAWCGFSSEYQDGVKSKYDYGDSVRAKFIFVGFPDDPTPVDTLLYSNLQPAVVDSMKSWLTSHSQGNFNFTSDSGIVFVPGHSFSSSDTALSWHADLPAEAYLEVDTAPEYSDYRCRWGAGGSCDEVADLSTWRNGTTISYLLSEILFKVYDSYVGGDIDESKWPFGVHDSINDDAETVDVIFIVFMTVGHVWTYGGTIGIDVNSVNVEAFSDDAGKFFGNLAKTSGIEGSPSKYQGTHQRQNSSSYQVPTDFDVERCTFVMLHEFSHTLGFSDGPPNMVDVNGAGDTKRYYYGALNITSQHFMPGRGVPVLSLHNLEKLNWVKTIDFTGQNRLGEKVYDIRSDGGLDPEQIGKIFKFRMPTQFNYDQYFLFAYHAGRGADGNVWPKTSLPVLLSTGLEIQHIVIDGGNTPDIVDVESAFGLYENISQTTMPDIGLPPYPQGDISGWGSLASEASRGFDNYDLWWVDNDSLELRELEVSPGVWGDYNKFTGNIYDFFTADTLESNGEIWTSPEFSYRTNPNCFGYSEEPHFNQYIRHNIQDIPNSLFVRITEQHDNPTSGPPYMMVDFISAPFGGLLEPMAAVPGDTLFYSALVDTVIFKWTSEFQNAIDRVDIELSTNGGITYPEVIASVENDTTFAWVPDVENGTQDGRLRLVFRNVFNELTAEEYAPNLLSIAGMIVVAEDLLFPENGEVFEAGEICPVEWVNYWGSEIDSVSISFSIDDGSNWELVHINVNYWVNAAGNDQFDLLLTSEMVSQHAKFKLTFYSESGVWDDVSLNSFGIIPKAGVAYDDVTRSSRIEYSGEVYNFNSLDLGLPGSGDNGNDLFISFESEAVAMQLYQNQTDIGQIQFDNISNNSFEGNFPSASIFGSTSGDLNNDGNSDIVCTSSTDPGVYIFNEGINTFHNALGDTNYFRNADTAAFLNSCTTVLVDFDHDGDLDIFLGRASENNGELAPMADALFEQQADGHFVEVATQYGLTGSAGITQTAIWCDFDDDGFWEVIVGDAGDGPTIVYDQVGDSFIAREDPFPSGFSDGHVSGLQWVDLDRDDDFDLLVTRTIGSSYILLNEAGLFTSSLALMGTSDLFPSNGLAVDFDFDGWHDVVFSNGGSSVGTDLYQASLFRNLEGELGYNFGEFKNLSQAAGLGQISRTSTGLLFDDFSGNGFLDAMIGASNTADENIIFNAVPSTDSGQFETQWIGVDLKASADNQSSLGAVVTVKTLNGAVLGKQIVDGGSTRGGQQPRILRFGLGDINETIEITAYWPANPDLAISKLIDPETDGFNVVVPVEQGSALEICQPTISQVMEITPGDDLVDWVFTWRTNRLTQGILDEVEIWDGPNYTNHVVTLSTTETDVIVSTPAYKVDESTGASYFEHKVTWEDQECVSGYSFKYGVTSCIEDNCELGFATSSIVRIKACPLSQ